MFLYMTSVLTSVEFTNIAVLDDFVRIIVINFAVGFLITCVYDCCSLLMFVFFKDFFELTFFKLCLTVYLSVVEAVFAEFISSVPKCK